MALLLNFAAFLLLLNITYFQSNLLLLSLQLSQHFPVLGKQLLGLLRRALAGQLGDGVPVDGGQGVAGLAGAVHVADGTETVIKSTISIST